jgi:hypothetical protein
MKPGPFRPARRRTAALAALAALLALPVLLQAQQTFAPLDPDDARARVAAGLVQLLLGTDDAAIHAYFEAHAAAHYLSSDRFAAEVAGVRELLARPDLAIAACLRGPDSGVLIRLEPPSAPDQAVHVAVRVELDAPHRITGLLRPMLMRPPSAADAAGPLNPELRRQVVDSLAALMERVYAVEDTGRIIARHLRARQAEGGFDAAADRPALAAALTAEMRRFTPDRHLGVRSAPPAPPSGSGPGAHGSDPLDEPQVLEGNIGYLRSGPVLSAEPEAAQRLGAALHALRHTAAMIVDLRGVRGGSAELANAIISHFTPPGVPSLVISSRLSGSTRTRYTLAEVPGPRRLDVPLYVLVDSATFSAGEDVAFVLQNLGRAVIVGEQTRGAGRNNVFVPLGAGLTASISHSRVQDPATGREWEGVGIRPDVPASSADALTAALLHTRARGQTK